MKEERYQRHIKRIKDMAKKQGISEELLSTMFLDGMFGRGKMTTSAKTKRIAEIAYYRGMLRGVRFVKEAETPIVLHNGEIEEIPNMDDNEYIESLEKALIFMCSWYQSIHDEIFKDYVNKVNTTYEQLSTIERSQQCFAVKNISKLQEQRKLTFDFRKIYMKILERDKKGYSE